MATTTPDRRRRPGPTPRRRTDRTTDTTAITTTTETGDPTIGAEVSLESFDTTLAVTVTDYHPVEVGRYDNVPDGATLVGVEMNIENVGSVKFGDSPGNGAKLLTTAGVPLNPDFPLEGDCPADFSTSVDLKPGESASGCIAFQLRTGQEGGEFEWTPDSGYAEDSARWALPAP